MPISTSSNWPWRSGPIGDDDLALADDRILELRDLVALRQIRIEIVLAIEDRAVVDLRLQAKTGAHGLLDAFLVDDGQHAGHGGIDQRHIGVRRIAERRRCSGKQLGLACHLGMDFHADDHFPVAGGAGNDSVSVRRCGRRQGSWDALELLNFALSLGKTYGQPVQGLSRSLGLVRRRVTLLRYIRA